MKLAIISLGGKTSMSVLKESEGLFRKADHVDIRDVEVQCGSKDSFVNYKGKPLESYDCVYVRGSFKYALLQRAISIALDGKSYLPLRPEAFTLGHDKLLTLLALQKSKVPIPTTHLAATTKLAKKILDNVNYPVILKIPSGTQGKGVMFADSAESAKTFLDTLEVFKQPYIIQEFIETNATDVRALVIGGKVVAAMRRKASTREMRANIHMGGVGEPYELSYDLEQMAIKSAKAIGADICAVDILETRNKSAVIEVNLSPGIDGITKATKQNIALKLSKFLAQQSKGFKEGKKSDDYAKMMSDLDVSKNGSQELMTNLNIKAGLIRLPDIVTKITKFSPDEEVTMVLSNGGLEIKRHEIKKEEVKKKRRK